MGCCTAREVAMLEAVKIDNEKLMKNLKELNSTISSFKVKEESTNNEIKNLRIEIDAIKIEKNQLQEHIKELNSKIESSEVKESSTSDENKNLRSEIDLLKERYSREKEDDYKKLQMKEAEWEKFRKQLEEELKKKSEELKENDELKIRAGKINEDLNSEITNLSEIIHEVKEENCKLRTEKGNKEDEFNKQIQELKVIIENDKIKFENEIEHLKKEYKNLKDEKEKHINELEDKIIKLEQENDSLKRDVIMRQQKIIELEQENVKLKKAIQDLEINMKDLQEYKEREATKSEKLVNAKNKLKMIFAEKQKDNEIGNQIVLQAFPSKNSQNSKPSIANCEDLTILPTPQIINLFTNVPIQKTCHLNTTASSHLNLKKQETILTLSSHPIFYHQLEITSADSLTTISIPLSTINLFSYLQDELGTFKLPVTSIISTQLIGPHSTSTICCNSASGHIFSHNPNKIFKFWANHRSFRPQCSVCLKSNFYKYWSCESCDFLVCFNCKWIEYFCPEGHFYRKDGFLSRFRCNSCEKEKISVSCYCEKCDFRLCDVCSLLRSEAKLRCDNSHRLKKEFIETECFRCEKNGSDYSCECCGLCTECYQYLESSSAYHPGLLCNIGHVLHTVEKDEECSVCKEKNKFWYYCKDCEVFVCESCAEKYIGALYSEVVCDMFHYLEWDGLNDDIANEEVRQKTLNNFYCELCDISFSPSEVLSRLNQ